MQIEYGGNHLVAQRVVYDRKTGRVVATGNVEIIDTGTTKIYSDKIDVTDVFVFHDELDLAPAKLRVKRGGGNAGHNGLRSITAHCGNEYWRVRLGIGHPGDKALVYPYVLNDFAKAEMPWVEDLCTACADFAELLAAGDDPTFQNKVHLFMAAHGHEVVKRIGEKTAD